MISITIFPPPPPSYDINDHRCNDDDSGWPLNTITFKMFLSIFQVKKSHPLEGQVIIFTQGYCANKGI